MRVKFWGVRGSIPCPGPQTVQYGGNTACIEMRIDPNDRLIIVDAGSGIRNLGNYLMANDLSKGPICADIFLTHTHWDHIMGFPFFAPIYLPTSKLRIHGPVTYEEETLKDILGGQWAYRYFPIRHDELSSNIAYVNLKEGKYNLGQSLQLTTKYLNHPLLCLGYRFEFNGHVVCTAFDTEPFKNVFTTDPDDADFDADMAAQGEAAAKEQNELIQRFVQDADLLIYDSQYTLDEYKRDHIGWGHSPIEYAVTLARKAQVKRLALFHHDVQRTDEQLNELYKRHCRTSTDDGLEIFFAREGMELSV